METPRDLPRTVFAVLVIGALTGLSLWILRPFLPATLWATMIAVSTWPLMLAVEARLWKKRSLAVAVMTSVLLLVFIVPFALALAALATNADAIAERTRSLLVLEPPPPPEWVERIPFLGGRIAAAWRDLVAAGGDALIAEAKPHVGSVVRWFAGQVGNLGALAVQFLLTVLLTAILYARGETAGGAVRRFATRLAGAHGEAAVRLAGQAIRAVALGIVVTAIVQSVVGGIGLVIAGVPFAAVLTAVMFILSLAQLGPLLVLLPAVGWLYWTGASAWGTFLLVWTIAVATLDNVVRPLLIKKGADLPLLLIFAGVVGGLIAFGLVGIFIGPVLLAVAFTLTSAWVEARPDRAPEANAGPTQ